MRTFAVPLLFLLAAASPPELGRWRGEAVRVTITRDDWGIAHVHGATDADAVFGMMYAQAEDDFPRIEANYLTNLGRTAEAEGESAIWQDLRARLYVSETELRADYARSPTAMRRLMDAWADGLNYYLAAHPKVRPRVLHRFEPWMALSFTEGSIGGDIERIDLKGLEAFYGGASAKLQAGRRRNPAVRASRSDPIDRERQGSNGIAIAPKLTTAGKTLLLINPHTSWYFRSEQQVTSDEGLNVYGAATWGQLFIYQGFNAHAGWMHTSSGVDSVDEFAERIERRGGRHCYRYGRTCRPLRSRLVTIRYRKADGAFAERRFMVWTTHHGPIVRRDEDGRPIAFAMMDRPVEALEQSFLRTKATDLASFLRIAELKANSSNDTIFADDSGEVAYLHPQFVPRRDDRFDYTEPVDGSDPRTDWHGLHALSELPSVLAPPNGWVQNTNAWPYRAAGAYSPDPARFPKYMDMDGENFRGLHALALLQGSSGWTLDRLQAAAFDKYQPGFAILIPSLIRAYDTLGARDARAARLAGPIRMLRGWDDRWSASSVAQTLAMTWGALLRKSLKAPADEPSNKKMMRLERDTSADDKLRALDAAVTSLTEDFGRWQVPWGELNRAQRISNEIANPPYSDSAPSIPVPFADASYGSLASIRSLPRPGTKRWYGDYGNSFVAVVEFGPRVRARAVTAGGESGHPGSPHFNDEAQRYASGDLRDVYFYPDELKGHTERTYRPGE
ncbi:penicillin acylase family protein [Sphingomonas sp.]|uniref:penicillin acylase family protein n=1 Tax=Sphingomonas sp. TaxID=28214 RepID=UPI0025FAAC2D|nr:penicillin acylase family protein [Sphingomonas sp.]MBV9528752.1 penicillin acylase family protein [Sphingomonas sp.]